MISNPPRRTPAVPDVGPPARSDQTSTVSLPRPWTRRCWASSPTASSFAGRIWAMPASQAYLTRLPLLDARPVLALGCGTGVEVRALRGLTESQTTIVASTTARS